VLYLEKAINSKHNFENGLKLKIKMDVNPELIQKDVIGFVKFAIENYKHESKRYQYIFASYEVESLENTVFIKFRIIEKEKRRIKRRKILLY